MPPNLSVGRAHRQRQGEGRAGNAQAWLRLSLIRNSLLRIRAAGGSRLSEKIMLKQQGKKRDDFLEVIAARAPGNASLRTLSGR
jgi:hypothetical protein